MDLKKPSEFFDTNSLESEKKQITALKSSVNTPIIDGVDDIAYRVVESNNSLRDELSKVESLSEQVIQLQQELSQKVVQSDLEKLILSQIENMQENFEYLKNDFRYSNKRDIVEFKDKVSDLTNIVGNLVENEIPKYKKQVTRNEIYIDEKFDELNESVEENITSIREDIDNKVHNIAEVIDSNLEYFNNQLQKTSSEVKNTVNTYNKLSKIVESRISKENEQLEEYSEIIKFLYEEFVELQNSVQEKSSSQLQVIEEKFKTISLDVNDKIDNINEEVDNFKDEVSSEVSNIKADVVIFEKHNKDTEKTIQEFSEQLSKISEINEDISQVDKNIDKLQDQYDEISNQSIETKKNLEVVERYIQNHHQELVTLKEEVFAEIEQIPVGNLQENLERLEKKIDYIKETYSRIEPEVIVKEVIKEGLLNIPPEQKTPDPLTPLDQKFVTLDQLQEHYRLFINRIQQQLSTLGGGGETRLKYLDDIVGIATNASSYDNKFLKYNHSIGKFEFAAAGAGSQNLDDTLQLGNSSNSGMTVGVSTFNNVVVGGSNTALVVNGNARITGILTIGTGSITLNGTNDSIGIGTGLTITSLGFSVGVASIATLSGVGNTYIGLSTSIVPTIPSQVSLGTSAFPFKDIVISAGTLIIADNDPLNDSVAISNSNQYLQISRGGFKILSGIGTLFQIDPFTGLILSAAPTIITNSNNTSGVGSGALQVAGGSYIAKDLRVDGNYYGSGSNLTGIVTYITAGSGISVNQNTGNVTITAIGGTGGGTQNLNTTLGYGNTSSLGMSVGVSTFTDALGRTVIVGGPNTALVVNDNVRVTGVSTFGTTNTVVVGGATTALVVNDGAYVSTVLTAARTIVTANNSAQTPSLSVTGTVFSNPNKNGLFSVGQLTYNDTDLVANFTHNVNSYAQIIFENRNAGTTASTDFIVSNDSGGANSYYGDFGINASGFVGSSVWDDPNGTYLYSSAGSLSIGTDDAKDFRIATGSAANSPVTRITVKGTTGNIGIGSTLPTSALDVIGNAKISNDLTVNSNTLYVNATTNRVGISTGNPTSALHVVGNTLITGIATVGLANTSTPPSNSQMSFELTSNTNLRIKVRGTDGVLRSANITLA